MIVVKKTGVVNKPLEDLWKVSFIEFHKVGNWATGIFHSEKTKDYDRVCDTSFGNLYENITFKDEKNHKMVIDAKGLPFFVKKFTGGWTFRKITDNKTEFTVELKLETIPIIGSFMELFMRPKFEKALDVVVDDYKTYLETGKISKRKEIEILKLKKKGE